MPISTKRRSVDFDYEFNQEGCESIAVHLCYRHTDKFGETIVLTIDGMDGELELPVDFFVETHKSMVEEGIIKGSQGVVSLPNRTGSLPMPVIQRKNSLPSAKEPVKEMQDIEPVQTFIGGTPNYTARKSPPPPRVITDNNAVDASEGFNPTVNSYEDPLAPIEGGEGTAENDLTPEELEEAKKARMQARLTAATTPVRKIARKPD